MRSIVIEDLFSLCAPAADQSLRALLEVLLLAQRMGELRSDLRGGAASFSETLLGNLWVVGAQGERGLSPRLVQFHLASVKEPSGRSDQTLNVRRVKKFSVRFAAGRATWKQARWPVYAPDKKPFQTGSWSVWRYKRKKKMWKTSSSLSRSRVTQSGFSFLSSFPQQSFNNKHPHCIFTGNDISLVYNSACT